MPISKGALGINARNFLYIKRFNSLGAKRRADNKLATKRTLIKNNIPTPRLFKVFSERKNIREFDWNLPNEGFALKPARGYKGGGILVFRKWEGDFGETVTGKILGIKQIESHILDIFDGVYSLQSLPDVAFIEEVVSPHPFFKKLIPFGLPDIRVIVFNKIPVMAMTRLPTRESQGKATVNLGAIALGIDLRTGITKHGIVWDKQTEVIPETKTKVKGIKIPFWDEILDLSIKTQIASGLGFAGVDIVLDAKRGPLVLEINARPGLSIQNANIASLRSRLERIENIKIEDLKRGIEVGRSLFAEEFADKVKGETKVLSLIEPIKIYNNGKSKIVEAKLDSGAFRTSLDKMLAMELGFVPLNKYILIKAASGQQVRNAIKINFELAGKNISTVATVASRSHLKYPMIIGRRDLKGFLINPAVVEEKEDETDEDDDIEE